MFFSELFSAYIDPMCSPLHSNKEHNHGWYRKVLFPLVFGGCYHILPLEGLARYPFFPYFPTVVLPFLQMNSDPGLQIQLQSHREKPVFPSSLTLVKNLATDIPRFESVQILLRAVHKIIPFLCPPQWDGSATTVETCLKCLFHLVLKGATTYHREGGRSGMTCCSVCCLSSSGRKLLMGQLRPGSSLNSWCSGCEWGR